MIRNLCLIIAVAVIFVSCGGGAGTNDGTQGAATSMEATQSEIPMIAIDEFDTEAGEYVDQEVKVEGIVDHICRHGGKRLLLVSDNGDLHVDSDTRFEESIMGNHVIVKGIVREFRVDEAYCLKMEEDNIKSHSEGHEEEEHYERKMAEIEFYRDSMATAGVDHISFYSLDYVSHEMKEEKREDI